MSTEKTATDKAQASLTPRILDVDDAAEEPLTFDKVEITSLSIEETGDDCDPYNSTGQFLVEAMKKKYGE